MNQVILREIHKTGLKKVPEIRTGYTVKVHQKIKEGNKERIQVFEGLVIKVGSGAGLDKTFTMRKIASGVGVEKIFPLHSSNIAKIEIVKKAKIRRAKMYYMRERTGKSARLRETYGNYNMEQDEEVEEPAQPSKEDAETEEKPKEDKGTEAEPAEAAEEPEAKAPKEE